MRKPCIEEGEVRKPCREEGKVGKPCTDEEEVGKPKAGSEETQYGLSVECVLKMEKRGSFLVEVRTFFAERGEKRESVQYLVIISEEF